MRDPSNTIKAIHRALGQKIKTHTYRKTLATLMDDAGLPTRKASDQLGHSRTSQTQDAYFGRKRLATGAASVLDGVIGGRAAMIDADVDHGAETTGLMLTSSSQRVP